MKGLPASRLAGLVFLGGLLALPLTWFREPEALLYIHDQDWPLSLREVLGQLYLWSPSHLGSDRFVFAPLFLPLGLAQASLYLAGLGPRVAEMILMSALFALPGASALLLFQSVLGDNASKRRDEPRRWSALIGALLYALNLYLVLQWHGGQLPTVAAYGLLPLVVLLLWRAAFTPLRNPWVWGMGLGLLMSVVPGAHVYTYFSHYLATGLFLLTFSVARPKQRYGGQLLRVVSLGIVVAMGANLWWLWPTVSGYLGTSPEVLSALQAVPGLPGLSPQTEGLLSLFLLHTEWTWGREWAGRQFHSYAPIYDQNWLLPLVWLMIVIVCVQSLRRGKPPFMISFGGVFLVVTLFVGKGIGDPGGSAFAFLFSHSSLFHLLRTPETRMGIGIVFSLSALLAFSVYDLWNRWEGRRVAALVTVSLAAGILVYAWPLLTGLSVIERTQGYHWDRLVIVPDFYERTAAALNSDPEPSRVLLFPGITFGYYGWGSDGFVGPDLLAKLIPQPVIQQPEGSLIAAGSGAVESMLIRNRNLAILPLTNARYVVVRADYAPDLYGEPGEFSSEVEPFASRVAAEGPITLYRVKDEHYRSRIYAAAEATAVLGATGMLGAVADSGLLGQAPSLFLRDGDQPWWLSGGIELAPTHMILPLHTGRTTGAGTTDWSGVAGAARVTYLTAPEKPVASLIAIFAHTGEQNPSIRVRLIPDGPDSILDGPMVWVNGTPQIVAPEEAVRGHWFRAALHGLGSGHHNLQVLAPAGWRIDRVVVSSRSLSPSPTAPSVDRIREINPTFFRAHVSDATASFYLVFSESFDEGWEASIVPTGYGDRAWYEGSALLRWVFEAGARERIPGHRMVNGYANSWQPSRTGSYDVLLEYGPQRLFEGGMVVSLVVAVAAGFYLVRQSRRAP